MKALIRHLKVFSGRHPSHGKAFVWKLYILGRLVKIVLSILYGTSGVDSHLGSAGELVCYVLYFI